MEIWIWELLAPFLTVSAPTHSTPPVSIAWIAFTIKFSKTCSIWPGIEGNKVNPGNIFDKRDIALYYAVSDNQFNVFYYRIQTCRFQRSVFSFPAEIQECFRKARYFICLILIIQSFPIGSEDSDCINKNRCMCDCTSNYLCHAQHCWRIDRLSIVFRYALTAHRCHWFSGLLLPIPGSIVRISVNIRVFIAIDAWLANAFKNSRSFSPSLEYDTFGYLHR